jgi:hypothetical protein
VRPEPNPHRAALAARPGRPRRRDPPQGARLSRAGPLKALPSAPRAAPLERLLLRLATPLDGLRAWALSRLSRPLRPFIRSRELRVTATATVGFSLAALMSLWIPLWQLTLGPLIWGIPHIIGDLRYLILRRGLTRSLGFWILVIGPLAAFTHEPKVSTGALAALGAALLAHLHTSELKGEAKRAARARLHRALTLTTAAYLSATEWPREAHLALLHGHNLITLGLWWNWRPRQGLMWLPLTLLTALSALVLFGWEASAWRAANPNEGAFAGLTLGYFEASLAGDLPAAWRPQWVALYGLLQSAHYLAWVRLIPEDDRPGETPITFQRSVSRLMEDLGEGRGPRAGAWALAATLLLMVGLALWATQEVARARMAYLTWISAHAALELALIAYLYVLGRPLRVGRG